MKVTKPIKGHNVLAVSVIDTGCGIKNDSKVKLFKLFGTLQDTRQMNTQGIGLGLVISENIIKAFEGSIGLRSIHDVGTQFTFAIPLKFKPDTTNKNDNIHGADSLAVFQHSKKPKDASERRNGVQYSGTTGSNLTG